MEGAHAQNLVSSNKTPGEQHCKTNHTQFRASARIHHLEHTHTRANTHARARANEFPICFRTRACAAEISLSHLTFIIYSRASRATTRLLSGGANAASAPTEHPAAGSSGSRTSSYSRASIFWSIMRAREMCTHCARSQNQNSRTPEPVPTLLLVSVRASDDE